MSHAPVRSLALLAVLAAAAVRLPAQAAPALTSPTQAAHPSFDVAVTGAGRPIILIPGLLSSGEVWSATVDRYKDRHSMHVLTLAGFGGGPPVGEPFLPRVRDEVIAYIRAQKLEKPIVVGHSLGGFLGFWIAATAPESIGGLVAVDGVPFMPGLSNPSATAAAFQDLAGQMKSLYGTFSRDQVVAQSRIAMKQMVTAPADLERVLSWTAKSDPATAGIALAELLTMDLREPVAAIAAPVLLLGATGSMPEPMRPTAVKAYEAQVSRIKGARVIMAGKAKHFIMLDDPAFFFSALDEFLAGLR